MTPDLELAAAVQVAAVLALEPDNVPALLLMSRTQVALGHPETAIAAADRACELAPANGEAHDARSAALTAAGRHDEAVAAAELAVQCDPHDAERYDRLARALLAGDRVIEAERAAQTAIAIEPGIPALLMTLAAAQAALGHRDQARRTLFAVLELDPQHVEARVQLSTLVVLAQPTTRRPHTDRGTVIPALAIALVGVVLLAGRLTAAGVSCLALAAVLLLGGFPQKRSE